MNTQTRGTAEMIGAMLISGTIGFFVVLSGQSTFNVVFWRCAFGAATLLITCVALGIVRPGVISWRQAGLAALGGVALVLNWIFLFSAYPRASISIATVVYNTQPFMLVILGAVFLAERPALVKLAWLGVSFTGMLLVVQMRPEAGYVGQDYLVGIGFALVAAFSYAIAATITKRLKGVPPQLVALIEISVGILMLLPLADFRTMPVHGKGWLILILIGTVHTGFMYILLCGAIQKLPLSITGVLSFIYPVVAIAVDFIAFGVRLHPTQLAGAALILFAAAGSMFGWSFTRRVKA